jgi:uncharacterized protein YndB with AHSA1/START domain
MSASSDHPAPALAGIDPARDLVLTRLIDAPPARVFQAWSDPVLVPQWFTPPPFKTLSAEMDLRPGGSSLIVMQGPDGTEYPQRGVYLEVVPDRRLVFTDAYVRAWEPSAKPFFTGILTFDDEGGKTRYTAVARHWTQEDRDAHENMGFHVGWGIATDQMEAMLKRLFG